MIRYVLSLVFLALTVSCSNTPKDKAGSENITTAKVEFATLAENPDNFIGKNVSVEGKVVHVCMHSGKKLFIVGENPDIRLYIQAGENMPKFPMELLGSNVMVEGKLTRVSGSGAMPSGSEGMHTEGGISTDTCETETALANQTALADVMMEYISHAVIQ